MLKIRAAQGHSNSTCLAPGYPDILNCVLYLLIRKNSTNMEDKK